MCDGQGLGVEVLALPSCEVVPKPGSSTVGSCIMLSLLYSKRDREPLTGVHEALPSAPSRRSFQLFAPETRIFIKFEQRHHGIGKVLPAKGGVRWEYTVR